MSPPTEEADISRVSTNDCYADLLPFCGLIVVQQATLVSVTQSTNCGHSAKLQHGSIEPFLPDDRKLQKVDLCKLKATHRQPNSGLQILRRYVHDSVKQRGQICGNHCFQLCAKNTAVIPRPTTITIERITDTGSFLASLAPI